MNNTNQLEKITASMIGKEEISKFSRYSYTASKSEKNRNKE